MYNLKGRNRDANVEERVTEDAEVEEERAGWTESRAFLYLYHHV